MRVNAERLTPVTCRFLKGGLHSFSPMSDSKLVNTHVARELWLLVTIQCVKSKVFWRTDQKNTGPAGNCFGNETGIKSRESPAPTSIADAAETNNPH